MHSPQSTSANATLTLEEQAKRAHQYADCLKAAVNNAAIICKP